MQARLIWYSLIALLLVGPATAGGDYYARKTLSSTLGSCRPPMTQIERLQYGANVHGMWEGLAVACMVDPQRAIWAIVATLQCGDDSFPVDNCFDPGRRGGVPLLFEEQSFYNFSGGAQPLDVDYTLVKYAAGRDCRIGQIAAEHEGDVSSAWSCGTVAFIDGTRDARGRSVSDPTRIRVRQFHSKAAVPFTIEYPGENVTAPFGPLPIQLADQDERAMFDITNYAR